MTFDHQGRFRRIRDLRAVTAYSKVLSLIGGKELFDELKSIHRKAVINGGADAISLDEARRYNEIVDQMVAAGVREDEVEAALGE